LAVIKIAFKPIPFANGASKSMDEFEGVSKRSREATSNARDQVLHGFSCAVPEVRKPGTSERITGDIMRIKAIQGVQKGRV